MGIYVSMVDYWLCPSVLCRFSPSAQKWLKKTLQSRNWMPHCGSILASIFHPIECSSFLSTIPLVFVDVLPSLSPILSFCRPVRDTKIRRKNTYASSLYFSVSLAWIDKEGKCKRVNTFSFLFFLQKGFIFLMYLWFEWEWSEQCEG